MRRLTTIALLASALGIAGSLAACTSTVTPTPMPAPGPASTQPLVVQPIHADTSALVTADDGFGFDLLASNGQQVNVAMSPASVALALQMVGAGAQGDTATQIAHVLHLPDAASAAPAAQALMAALEADEADHSNTLRVSNTLWTQQGYPLNPDFTDTLRTRFAAVMHQTDFSANPEAARDAINAAVAEQTDGKIPTLFPAGTINADCRLVLTNADYLNATWARTFDPRETGNAPFTRADGSGEQVSMMHSQGTLDYYAGPNYQLVSLPYAGGRLAFTVLLPTGSTSTSDLVAALRQQSLSTALRAATPTEVQLSLPKFHVHSGFELAGSLTQLGMPDAFDTSANFAGITSKEQLMIKHVVHQADVQVDEHGTVAAAGTGISMGAGAAAPPRDEVVFTVDHPFLFVITDTRTEAPLFLGRIGDPTAS